MKKTILKNLLLCLLFVFITFSFSSCGNEAEDTEPSVKSIDITLSIDYPKKSGIDDVKKILFKIEEDTSVLQTIELYGNVYDIPVLVDTTNSTLEGINGIINHVTLKDGHWEYQINGKKISKSENKKIVESGDFVEFIYVKE